MKKYLIILIIAVVLAVGLFLIFRDKLPFGVLNSVELGGGGDLSAQAQTLDALGYPEHFAIEYLPLFREQGVAFIRHEVWYYPLLGKKVVFSGGNIAYTDRLDVALVPGNKTVLKPEDFDYSMTIEEVNKALSSNGEQIDFLPGVSDEEGIQMYIAKNAFYMFEDSSLVYFQTIDPGAAASSSGPSVMLPKKYLDISLANIAQARGFFKDTFKCIKKVCKFVIEAPEKITRPITRPLGPVFGQIASAILTQNISSIGSIGHILRDAQRIDTVIKSVEEQRKLVLELRRVYTDQANELKKRAGELQKDRDALGPRLVHGVITFDEYKQSVMDIDAMISSLQTGATKMEQAGSRVNEAVILRMLGKDILKQLVSQTQGIIMNSLSNELRQMAGLDVVMNLVAQGNRGSDAVLDLLISSELRGTLSYGDSGVDLEVLKGRIRDGLKEMIKQNRADLRSNWKQRIADLINKTKQELQKNAPKQNEISLVGTKCETKVEKKSEDQCDPGYVFQRMSGVGCVQAECKNTPNAHWSYECYCVCGS
ncbi:MAG: hypothetical protein NTV62_01860, partial [Candidatus Gribaldobacteria bacterium]|nr:hypothetical protein [Candidatus Gribaldobacteria bacterium]